MAVTGILGARIQNVGTETPGAYVAVGERFYLWYGVQNTGQLPLMIRGVYLCNGAQRPEDMSPYRVFAPEGVAAYVAVGETRTHTIPCTMCGQDFGDGRTCQPYLHIYCASAVGAILPDMGMWLEPVKLEVNALDMRYRPAVTALDVARTPNEDSAQVKLNVRCALAEGANAQDAGLLLTVRWRAREAGAFAPEDSVTVPAAQALTAAGAEITLADTFPASGGFVFRAVFTDGYDSGSRETILARAAVNFHLAGSGYGVAVGMYSSGTEEAPLFECAYPARFYAGIEGGTVKYSTDEVDTGNVWLNGKKIYSRMVQYNTGDGYNSVEHPFDFSNMATVWIDQSASFLIYSGDYISVPHGYVAGNGDRQFMAQPRPYNNTILVVSDGAGTAYIRLLYTKTAG